MSDQTLTQILNDVLQVEKVYHADTALLGAIAEFDSTAIITVITAIEDEFGFTVDDDEISADIFQTFGTLANFVAEKNAS